MKKSRQPYFIIWHEVLSENPVHKKKAITRNGKYFMKDIVQGPSFKKAMEVRMDAWPTEQKHLVRFILQEECKELGLQIKY
jgi:hypothetical protein